MADGLKNVQDVDLISCKIVGASGEPYDIRKMVLEINYFEDIFNNVCSGNLIVSDSQNIINLFSMNGSEVLYLEFDTPGTDNPVNKKFRIYSVSDRTIVRDQNEFYILNFASEELILSEKYRISKSFKNKTISDIVQYIADLIEIPSDKIEIEKSIGLRDILIPNYKPIEAINWLCTHAVSEAQSDSSFIFYENKDGYQFKSLRNLYQAEVDPKNVFQYGPKNINSEESGNMLRDLNKDVRNVFSYEICSLFNSAKNAHTGAMTNKLITLDPVRGVSNSSIFDYNSYSADGNKLNMNDLDRFGETVNDIVDNVKEMMHGALSLAFTNMDQRNAKYFQKKDFQVNDNKVETNIPYRTAQFNISTAIRLKIVISGDTSMTVGTVIEFNLPSVSIRGGESKSRTPDEYYSGKYLITALRHTISQENKFFTTLEICKDSLESNLPDYDNNNQAVAGMRK